MRRVNPPAAVVASLLLPLPLLLLAAPPARAALPAPAESLQEIVYDGGLKGGWQDWGWARRNLVPGRPAQLHMNRYAGWILARREPSRPMTALTVVLRAPAAFGDFVEVRLGMAGDEGFPKVPLDAAHRVGDARGGRFRIAMAELNPSGGTFDRIVFRARRAVGDDVVELDKVLLYGGPDVPAPPPDVAQMPHHPARLTVDCRAAGHPISPLIYGIAFNPRKWQGDAFQWETGTTARRWGGNPASRYNWELGNAWNTASDWFFSNVNYTRDPDFSWKKFLADNQARHVATALTVPTIGWVAKDTESVSFPVSEFGSQQYAHGAAGNGLRPDRSKIDAGSPSRTSVPASPEFIGRWVAAIAQMDAAAGTRHVSQYILDNEPALWNSTHRDIHPAALTYDELLERTLAYGTAVRRADPKATIVAPAEWGWPAYFWSARDAEVGFTVKPDRRQHGDVPLLDWFLRQVRAHETRTGVHLLDVVDLHFYPQGQGTYGGHERVDPEGAARRVRAVRSLWDPTYEDESWIKDRIRLLPRMQEIIAREAPGLKISIGEYNFGGERHVSGAIAQAEALGRFAEYGVHSAFYWTYPPDGSANLQAFRAFRNYDGAGGHFLDHYVPTTGDASTSVFVSRGPTGREMVAIAINRDGREVADLDLNFAGCGEVRPRRVFQYSGGREGLQPLAEAPTRAGASLRQQLLPFSITVYELTADR